MTHGTPPPAVPGTDLLSQLQRLLSFQGHAIGAADRAAGTPGKTWTPFVTQGVLGSVSMPPVGGAAAPAPAPATPAAPTLPVNPFAGTNLPTASLQVAVPAAAPVPTGPQFLLGQVF